MTRRAQSEPGRVHIVGAGLAGLAAAVELTAAGRPVCLHEAAPHAGGRCRSYFDTELGCRIDNGNHLVLSGNNNTLAYVERLGALGTLKGPTEAAFPFIDVATKQRWTLRLNHGALPWWIFASNKRVPETQAIDYCAVLSLRRVDPSKTVAAALNPDRSLFRRLWGPLVVAALNTSPEQASAELFWRILVETLGRGGMACCPLVPQIGLSETFVEPALARLRVDGAEIRFGSRLKAFTFEGNRVSELVFDGDSIRVSAADRIVDATAPDLRPLFWQDVALAYRLPADPVPPARIVKERRATFLASPEQLKRRPQPITAWRNLLLAGDYVDTGLPATIEGAIRSGFAVARLVTGASRQELNSMAVGQIAPSPP